MTSYLFVYGLLRRKAKHEMSKLLIENAQFISEGTFQGKLYLIDYYPGVIPSDNPKDQVYGDIFKVHDSAIFADLDRFEGVGSGYTTPSEYLRELRTIELSNARKIQSWIYLYNWSVKTASIIASGDFFVRH